MGNMLKSADTGDAAQVFQFQKNTRHPRMPGHELPAEPLPNWTTLVEFCLADELRVHPAVLERLLQTLQGRVPIFRTTDGAFTMVFASFAGTIHEARAEAEDVVDSVRHLLNLPPSSARLMEIQPFRTVEEQLHLP